MCALRLGGDDIGLCFSIGNDVRHAHCHVGQNFAVVLAGLRNEPFFLSDSQRNRSETVMSVVVVCVSTDAPIANCS